MNAYLEQPEPLRRMHAAQDSVLGARSIGALDRDCDALVPLHVHVVDHGFCGADGHVVGVIGARV